MFCLEEGERGETNLVELHIDTGDAPPRSQSVRCIPFAIRQEVAHQLRQMQANGVIQPSESLWAGLIVLVKKKDGSLRFCINYRDLNSVTKSDKFPLPRIDDLLDQLGQSQSFSTLDLTAGYWQIKVNEQSKENTTFITHRGLFEFRVMSFGLTIDDHINHLRQVLSRLRSAGLKLKLMKCHFLRQSIEYLGHVITPVGLKPNSKQVAAVEEFPIPENISQVRQFIGLTSYYRRFVKSFTRIASPLHALTRKNAEFNRTAECQSAFESLKNSLVNTPVLVCPDFD